MKTNSRTGDTHLMREAIAASSCCNVLFSSSSKFFSPVCWSEERGRGKRGREERMKRRLLPLFPLFWCLLWHIWKQEEQLFLHENFVWLLKEQGIGDHIVTLWAYHHAQIKQAAFSSQPKSGSTSQKQSSIETMLSTQMAENNWKHAQLKACSQTIFQHIILSSHTNEFKLLIQMSTQFS